MGQTQTAADYLMTVRYMRNDGQPVIAARLAERLGVSAATVSEMVSRLIREGLMTADGTRQLDLTDRGRTMAEQTFRKHALAEWLLTEVVGLGWAEADEEAHHLQHALSDRVTDKIDELLGRPPTCPHGNPIPGTASAIPWSELKSVAAMTPGESGRLVRLLEDVELDHDVLKFLEDHRLMPGRDLLLVEVAPDDTRTLEVDGTKVALGGALADNLWVLPA